MVEARQILRIATIAAGVLLLSLSVVRFIKISTLNFAQTVLTIYMM